ncbi:uncharacterized protein LOC108706783 isoform X3 [Xenopus laevis]|uniref:Uncharacterized protein LOC108706783 isoform X3 n=1 Tax=Xenopus laevis TaxID=8355 RepID=A0A8J1M2Y5_XENLA|nr:uncharacterized protein LOC108706783 isoform X3 [Xenopus laevis]
MQPIQMRVQYCIKVPCTHNLSLRTRYYKVLSPVMDLHPMIHIHEQGTQQEILQEDSNANQRHRERIFRPRVSLFGLNEEEVRSRYRFSTEVILELFEQIQQDIEPNCERNHAVPGMVKLLSALHYFASASFQGDDAYPLTEYLLTPVKDAKTKAEEQYNAAHKLAHSIIERTFGSIKSRFRCLDRSGGVLQYSPEKGAQIILACCILHNLAVSRNLHVDILDDLEAPPPVPPVAEQDKTQAAKRTRIRVINQYFT